MNTPWAVFVEQPDGSRQRLNHRVHESQDKALDEARREMQLRETKAGPAPKLVTRQLING